MDHITEDATFFLWNLQLVSSIFVKCRKYYKKILIDDVTSNKSNVSLIFNKNSNSLSKEKEQYAHVRFKSKVQIIDTIFSFM